MKATSLTPLATLTAMIALFLGNASAQLVLDGPGYAQDFNDLTNGLPAGWSVRTNATSASLGTAITNAPAAKTWGDTSGAFGNCASTVNNAGSDFLGTESTTVQGNATNRCLAVRQTGSFGDPGAAFVLQISDTLGVSNLTFSLDLNLLRTNSASTTWTIDYDVGDSPVAFTLLGTYPDPEVFGATNVGFTLGADANDQPQNVWIRIVALAASTGTGTRDTFGIDNFNLTYNNSIPAPAPLSISINTADGDAVLTWTDPTGLFRLVSGTNISGITNPVATTSPFTNSLGDPERYFRLVYP